MNRPTDDPMDDLDPDIAEVLMSRLDFREEPEEAGSDEPEPAEADTPVAVEWTPPANASPGATKVVRAPTGNRTHAASPEEVQSLAREHGLHVDMAEKVAAGRMTLQSAVRLRRMRAARARRDLMTDGRSSDKRLLVLFVALMAVFVWVLLIQ